MVWTKEEQKRVIEQFYFECVRYWEESLKTDSDLDKQPYINALKELPKQHPYTFKDAPFFDEDVREEFKKYRLMDIYGNDWESHLKEV